MTDYTPVPTRDLDALYERVEQAERQRDEALAVLRGLEWCLYGPEDSCPECHWTQARGHDDGCALAAAIGGEKAA